MRMMLEVELVLLPDRAMLGWRIPISYRLLRPKNGAKNINNLLLPTLDMIMVLD
jgi:hypothetical protein